MNKRKVTKCKGSKIKPNNDPSEVFVLPPNLLEALGINLGNIETVPESTSGNQISEKDLTYKEKSTNQGTPRNLSETNSITSSEKELPITKSAENDLLFEEKVTDQGTHVNIPENNCTTFLEKETSIIQTANLMKESVILSPTFISNNRCIIGGEVEIVGNAELVHETISELNAGSEKYLHDQSDQYQEDFSMATLENPCDTQSSEATQESNRDVQSNDANVQINSLSKDINYDDHADEAYSSDGSNGNIQLNNKSDDSNSSVLLPINNSKKICIISEQILDPSKFKALKSSYSADKSSLIPVTMNTVLKSSIWNSNFCQNSMNSDCDPNIVTCHIAPAVTIDSNLRDQTEQNLECEYVTDPLMKNESLKENDCINQTAAICDSLNNYLNLGILSNVSEDIVIDTQIQEESSQNAFKAQNNEYDTHLVLPVTLNHDKKGNIMETNISDTRYSNKGVMIYEEGKVNETMQTIDPQAYDIQNFYVYRNPLSSVSEDVTIGSQILEGTFDNAFELHKSEFDIQFELGHSFNHMNSNNAMETNISDTKNTNTIINVEEGKASEALEKNNAKSFDEQNLSLNCNNLEFEGVASNTKDQNDLSQNALEVPKGEFDTQLLLPNTLNREDSGNMIETTFSNTTKAQTVVSDYEELKINETLQKVNLTAVDEQNIHIDNKHQELPTKLTPDEINTKLDDNIEKTSHDVVNHSKRKSDIFCVKDSKIKRVCKDNLAQNPNSNQSRSKTNVKKQKLNDKAKHTQVITKVLKRTRHNNSNMQNKEMLVDADTKPTQKIQKKLQNGSVIDNNMKMIECNNISLGTSKADHSAQLRRLGINNDVQEDRIREIAGYLSKFAELQKRKKIIKERQNIRGIKIFTNKKHATNTKLSIQGVEKPGGSNEGKNPKNDENIKTYERKKKYKPPVKVSLKKCNYDTLTQKINLPVNESCYTCNDTDLCHCDDFGRLIYDDESMHEHIHFWNRKGIDCTPDLIFSIYNENFPAKICNDDTKNLQEHPYIAIEKSSTPDREICWNEINSSDSKVFDKERSEYTVNSSHETVENTLQKIDKPIETSVGEQIKPDGSKCSRSQVKSIENWRKKAMESVSQLESDQETNNIIVPDLNPIKNRKKRKFSSPFNESDKPVEQHAADNELALVKSDKIVKKQKCLETGHTEKIISGDKLDFQGSIAISLNEVTSIVCGVCRQNIKDTDWLNHIASQHNYLSWRDDEQPLDLKNRQLLIQHLATLIKQYGVLSCSNCGTTRKYAKPFLQHINQCTAVEEYHSESALTSSSDFGSKADPTSVKPVTLVECGVCGESFLDEYWHSHIGSQHNYLAWKCGEQPLDVDDEDKVKEHLYNITKEYGGLKCAKCGLVRKYVKSYQTHIKSCDGQSISESLNESSSKGSLHIVSEVEPVRYVSDSVKNVSIESGTQIATDDLTKCGACGEFMHDKDWYTHIGSQHNYLAWKHGEQSLDVDDEGAVKEHLINVMKECGELKCAKCGLIRKYVKSYQTHIRNCDEHVSVSESISGSEINYSLDVSEIEPDQRASDLISNINIENEMDTTTDFIQCAVCGDSMHSNDWYDHIGQQHNYFAWRCGEPTLDFVDEEATYKHLYAITKEYGGLKCVKCGLIRKYVKSYLTHVKNCTGLSDSQTDSVFNELSNVSEVEPAKIMNNLRSENEVNNILLKCGVCEQIVQNINWYSHIRSEHNYLAWKYGEPALDVDQEEVVREHLYNIIKQYGRLDCTKCGVTKKYFRHYLAHVKNCDGRSVKTKDAAPNIVVLSEAEQHTGLIKCGVCGQYMPLPDWPAHIEGKHNYLAWKDDETPLDVNNKAEVREHLKNIVKELGKLVCMKCGAQRKFTKSYMRHIEKCDGSTQDANNSNVTDEVIWPTGGADQVKCGVCDELVQATQWIKHIAEQHDYLAKKVGETPLDVDNEEQVYKHLYNIVKVNGEIVCQKCGKERKYVKSYLEHIRKCGQDLSVAEDTTFEANATSSLDTSESLIDFYGGGTCGVCEKEVEAGKWIQHIQKEHNYLAWRKGEKPWNLDDFTEVNEYLYEITKKMNGLTCNKCGLVRKYVKSYLTHIKSCDVVDFNLSSIVPDGVGPVSDKAYRCAMCQKEIEPSNWKDHAMKEHYNITWIIGETPIDIKNPYAVEKYLKEYKQYHSLKCNACGATRASFAGFYAHIITCGKSEEQIEMFQSVCDICNNKYLCIYKNQHMMIHKVQSYSKELKMSKQSNEGSDTSGKRQAAQKARSVLETYCSDMSQHSHKCSTCGFGTDFKEEMDSHKCNQNEKDFSADEGSEVEGEGSEDESIDSEVDSDVSREEAEDQEQSMKRKLAKEPVSSGSKVSRIDFKVEDPNAYLEKCDVDFCKAFYTDDTLFSKWLTCERETVSENDLPKYLPPMEQSCKVKAGFDWTTLKRFEAKNGDGISLFVGACIVSVAWVPLRVEEITGDGQNFLAIACHNDVDCPRYLCDETPQHECLIQIWDFGTCEELPRIVYGIAHDFGTVWSMDWCPSGARDVLPEDLTDGKPYRLGLLAVACSNGSAYIFSVPHPASVVKDNHFIQKLKPVAELRMKMFATSDRVVYQATSITWCKQKGHEIVLVGYADGTTGYFDVNNESPLSRKVEDDVEIFFPYDEKRPHNTCITATDMYPYSDGGFAACSASPTGAEMCIPSMRARVRSQLPARAAIFSPHWPSTLLAGVIPIMSTAVNELDWGGGGRKLGGVRALAGCWRCGHMCGAAPPALRLMRPHPVYTEFKKPIIGMIEMVPLAKKRNKQVNDELAMKIEPRTYPDAISKYGIQFQSVSKRDKVLQKQCGSKPKVLCPERFPLADVESMAFCLSKRHHDKLAVATHSGIVFFTDVNS